MKMNLFNYSAPVRMWILLLVYAVELCASLWIAYELTFDFMVDGASQKERLFVLLWLVPLQLILLGLFHQLTPLLGYFSTPDLARMFHALTLSAIIALVVWAVWGVSAAPPRGVIVLNYVFALVGLTGVRLFLRASGEMMHTPARGERHGSRRVGIIGAGDAGAVLAHELSLKPGLGLHPVAFFDDDERKWHSRVHDVPVLGAPEKLLEVKSKLQIEQVIIAMPSAPARRVGELVRLLREAQFKQGLFTSSIGEIEHLITMYQPKIVFIDGAYLIRLPSAFNRLQRWERITEIIERLKVMAMRNNIPVVLSFQFNRERRQNESAATENIQYSDSIGMAATVLFGVYRLKERADVRKIKVLDNRNGPRGELLINWKWENSQFTQLESFGEEGEPLDVRHSRLAVVKGEQMSADVLLESDVPREQRTDINIAILDRSGSMSSVRNDTIGGIQFFPQ